MAEGATLTIQPGVTVEFRQYQGLWVSGHLQAIGTAADPITFRGSTGQKGWWRGIHISGEGSARFERCDVAHAGYFDSVGVQVSGTGSLVLRHSTLREHVGDALRLGAGYSQLTSERNSFRECTRGVRLGTGATWDDATSDFSGNTVNVHADSGTFTGDVVWALKPAYSVFVSGGVIVGAGATLTIRPGTVVK